MAILRVQRTQAALSGQIEDATVNTLYFDTSGDSTTPTPTTIALITTEIDTLFNTAVGGGSAIRFFMAESTMGTDQNSYKVFNMDHVKPRVPVATPIAQNVTPKITTIPYPAEVACCLSFRGSLVSGAAAGRRRGRIFVGPLNTSAGAIEVATGHARPTSALLTALTAGANRMFDNLLVNLITWGIYSETARAGGAAIDGFTPVSVVWADNAFDTQRRRGIKANTRTTLAV